MKLKIATEKCKSEQFIFAIRIELDNAAYFEILTVDNLCVNN